ncbi:putative sugar phosphate transporter domain-containing protein [Helianthus debilis subsp. tardiflorus]
MFHRFGICLVFEVTQVVLAHKIGHVAATVSMSKLAVSFTHIIKSVGRVQSI